MNELMANLAKIHDSLIDGSLTDHQLRSYLEACLNHLLETQRFAEQSLERHLRYASERIKDPNFIP